MSDNEVSPKSISYRLTNKRIIERVGWIKAEFGLNNREAINLAIVKLSEEIKRQDINLREIKNKKEGVIKNVRH